MPITAASYTIKVRDASLNLIGEVDAFDQMEMISRFNAPGTWQMQLADNHPMASYLATPGYGIYVLRNNAYYFSGPVRYIDRKGIASNSLIVAGYDDMFWLTGRQAWPLSTGAYSTFVSAQAVLRAYTLGDTGTSTAVDFSPFTQNGAYHGSYTQGQPSLIDDPALSTSFQSTGYVSVPTSGLPVNNLGYGMEVWFYYSGAPGGTIVLGFLGVPSSASCSYMGILTTGKPTMQVKGIQYSATTALAVGIHHMFLNYDGTTAKLWVDNAIVASGTPGTCTLSYASGFATFGAYGNGTTFNASQRLQFAAIYQGALGNASLPGSALDGLPWPQVLYQQGLGRFTAVPYDSQTGAAETVIKHYADINAGPSALTERQVPSLTIETDAGTGTLVTFNARFERLIDLSLTGLLQILANAGGVGMKVVQSGTGLIFKVFTPVTANGAKFSTDLGNLGSYEYVNDSKSLVNYVIVGGGGSGLNRPFYQQGDAASIASWGRYEGWVNAGSSTDLTQLANQAADALANGASKLTLNADLYETDGVRYVRDFNLGDKVSVTIDGATLTDIVREVSIKLDVNGGETLQVGVGTPSNGRIMAIMQRYEQLSQKIGARLELLEKV